MEEQKKFTTVFFSCAQLAVQSLLCHRLCLALLVCMLEFPRISITFTDGVAVYPLYTILYIHTYGINTDVAFGRIDSYPSHLIKYLVRTTGCGTIRQSVLHSQIHRSGVIKKSPSQNIYWTFIENHYNHERWTWHGSMNVVCPYPSSCSNANEQMLHGIWKEIIHSFR